MAVSDIAPKEPNSYVAQAAAQEPSSDLKFRLAEIMESTRCIFESIDGTDLEALSANELANIAAKLEEHVAKQRALLTPLRPASTAVAELCQTIEDQTERLDSLAETFRLAVQPAFRERTLRLIESAAAEASTSTRVGRRR